MKVYAETERLLLREILESDVEAMFELDKHPEVHRYLGKKPITTIQQAEQTIAFIRKQYIDFGIGRWAVIEKATGNFTGWSGLKLVTDTYNQHSSFYDIGYRFIKQYWGKGYASESAAAALNYGFNVMRLTTINGMANVNNDASNHVLRKISLTFVNEFEHDGERMNWYVINR